MNDLNDKKKMTEKKEAATRKKVVQSPEKTPSSSDYECLCPCKKYIVEESDLEDLSTAQASENVISKVQTKMHTDAYERNLRKLNLCVVKVPESNKATSKQRQEDDAKFCLETLKIEKRDFISCHRAGKPDPKKPDYCRPLIIKTADEESVNYYSNHGKGWKESSYWINLDLCRADREIRFLARKERKKRQDGAAQKNLLKNP
ncbi:hypothetical protein ACHWQZ_G004489 [Mnemiopsis leidyi]